MTPTASAAIATRPSSRMCEELGEAATALAEQVVLGHAALDERETVRVGRVPSHLAVRRLHLEARSTRRNDDRRDLVRSGQRRHRDEGCDRRPRVRDERLLAVDHPLATRLVELGPGARAAGVGAGVRLGETEPAERPPGAQVGEPALLLFGRAELVDRVGAEADARLERHRQRLVDAGQFLDRHAQPDEVAATAADRLRERDPEQPQLAHLPHRVERELVGAVPLLGVRFDLRRWRSRAPSCATPRDRRSVPDTSLPRCVEPASIAGPVGVCVDACRVSPSGPRR